MKLARMILKNLLRLAYWKSGADDGDPVLREVVDAAARGPTAETVGRLGRPLPDTRTYRVKKEDLS